MDLKDKKFVLVGGAGLIGSHTTDALLKEGVKEIENSPKGIQESISFLRR